MTFSVVLLEAIVAAAAMAGFYVAVLGPWNTRHFIALWVPIALLVWIILSGPIHLG